MLKFVKDGKKVLEVKDNGDVSYVSESLKEQGLKEEKENKEEN